MFCCLRRDQRVDPHDNSIKDGYHQASIIVALNLGNERMGYAISFRRCKDRIYTGTNGHALREDRIPTAVLLNPDRSPNSFGSNALDKYQSLASVESHGSYHLFERFKVNLRKDESFTERSILDSEGHSFPAIAIVALILKYLKDKAIETVESIQSFDKETSEDDILWIIPTYETSAHQFFREAANKAGMTNNVRFVLESDAVSYFCRHLQLQVTYKNEIVHLPIGNKFIVADLGAGKASISSYEILKTGKLNNLSRNVYYMDGLNIEDKFCELMEAIFGQSVLRSFKAKELYDYREMRRTIKREAISYNNETGIMILNLPQSFVELVKEKRQLTLTDVIGEYVKEKDSSAVSVHGETKLKFSRQAIEDLFWHYIKVVLDSLKHTMQSKKIRTISFVGGFSESAYIKKKIEDELSVKIAVLQEPQMAVLKGAILFHYEH